MKDHSVALILFGLPGTSRNAAEDVKYRDLVSNFIENGLKVHSVTYNDVFADRLETELLQYPAILVWVNPVEQGNDRTRLDALLNNLSSRGCFVSAHPDTILKMGTKDILYKLRDTGLVGDVKRYESFGDFRDRFLTTEKGNSLRILKQYRGNGGDGVFKIDSSHIRSGQVSITHAKNGKEERTVSTDEFFSAFEPFFRNGSVLIDQAWNPNIINGMVRCYCSGTKVAGFGYQEVNALYPITAESPVYKPPGKRFYFSEACGLFRDLKEIMEKNWIKSIGETAGVDTEMLPVIWDADFFINKVNAEATANKYSLCEINVSSVSPFPESSIPYMVNEVKKRLDN